MIIDNEFTISQYDGQQDLQLTNGVPSGIVSGSIQHNQYQTFLSNIKLIYGSQKPDGSIPTLLKNPDNTISSQSTLTSLKSGQSYYFVSHKRNPGNGLRVVFPYFVPTVNGITESVVDKALVSFNNPSVLYVPDDACTGPLPVTATVSNAVNGFPYTFIVKATGVNGSPSVVPASGTILCNSDAKGIIPLSVLFNTANNVVVTLELMKNNNLVCTDSMVLICGEEVIPTPVSAQSFEALEHTETKITPEFLSQAVSSTCPQEYVNIGKPDIFLNHDKVVYLNSSDITNPLPISVSVINTKKDNYEYTYRFNISSDTGNPVITPSTGSVYANTYKCGAGSSYSSGNLSAMLALNGAKTAVVNVQLMDKGVVVDNDYINVIYKRTDAHTDYSTYVVCPSLDNSNYQINLSSTNNGSTSITTTISGLSAGRKYYYSFDGVAANWPAHIYPRSGTFYPDESSFALNNMFVFDSVIEDGCSDCFPYSTGAAYSSAPYTQKFSIVKLNVRPEAPGCVDGTDKYYNIYCNNCLIQPTPTITTTPTMTPTPTQTATPTSTPTPTPTPSLSSFINLNLANNWTFSVNGQIIAKFTPADSSLNSITLRISNNTNVSGNVFLPNVTNVVIGNNSYGQLIYNASVLENKGIAATLNNITYNGTINNLNTYLS